MAFIAAYLGWMFDGMEMGLFPLVARPALMELVGADAQKNLGGWISAVISVFLIGAAIGGVFFGWLGDRIGRVKALAWSVLTYSIFTGLCAFAQAPWQLAALRFVASLGMGGEWALGVALVMEVWPSRSRPLLAGVVGSGSALGFLLIALLSLGLGRFVGAVGGGLRAVLPDPWVDALLSHGGWRLLMLMGALPALLTFFIRMMVPESERWRKTVRSAPRAGIADIFRSGLGKATLAGAGLSAVAILGTWGSVQWIPSWVHKMTHNEPGARETMQICLSIGSIVGMVITPLIAQTTTRRLAYFGVCFLSLVSCQILFRTTTAYDGRFLLLVGIMGAFTAGFYGWLPLYLPELFPTRVRATGQGFSYNAARVLATAGTLAGGQLLDFYREDYSAMCAVISLVYVIGMILIWFCPETKGRPLPE